MGMADSEAIGLFLILVYLAYTMAIKSAAQRAMPRLEQASTALFLCDVQERFAKAIDNFDHMVNASTKLIKAANILQMPVYATEQAPKALGSTVASLKEHLPPSTVYVPKTRFSMVLPSGETDSFLKKNNVQSVLLVGIESHVCVLQTTLDLLAKGINVFVVRDAVSSCNREEVAVAIQRMRTAGATVTTSESALFELMLDASHPNFKAISALIKEEKDRTKSSLQALM